MATAVISGGSYDYTQSLLPADTTPLGLVGMRGGGGTAPTLEQMTIFRELLQEALKKEIPLDNIDIVYVPEGDMLQLRVFVTDEVSGAGGTVKTESVTRSGADAPGGSAALVAGSTAPPAPNLTLGAMGGFESASSSTVGTPLQREPTNEEVDTIQRAAGPLNTRITSLTQDIHDFKSENLNKPTDICNNYITIQEDVQKFVNTYKQFETYFKTKSKGYVRSSSETPPMDVLIGGLFPPYEDTNYGELQQQFNTIIHPYLIALDTYEKGSKLLTALHKKQEEMKELLKSDKSNANYKTRIKPKLNSILADANRLAEEQEQLVRNIYINLEKDAVLLGKNSPAIIHVENVLGYYMSEYTPIIERDIKILKDLANNGGHMIGPLRIINNYIQPTGIVTRETNIKEGDSVLCNTIDPHTRFTVSNLTSDSAKGILLDLKHPSNNPTLDKSGVPIAKCKKIEQPITYRFAGGTRRRTRRQRPRTGRKNRPLRKGAAE